MDSDLAKDATMSTSDRCTVLPATSFHPDTMVTLLVGHEEQEMTVHGDRLARNSACFRAALRQEWLEGQTRTVKLPDESQAIVQHYIEYVYSGELPANTLTKDADKTIAASLFHTPDSILCALTEQDRCEILTSVEEDV